MSCENLNYEIEKTKDGFDILRINIDNKKIYIGSKYNMQRDIDKFVNEYMNIDMEKSILLVYGFGAGEHIKALRQKFSDNEIIIFEPNKKMKNYIDNIEWIREDKKITITYTEQVEIKKILREKINEFNVEFINIAYFANYNKVFYKQIKNLDEELTSTLVSLKADSNTNNNMSKTSFLNLLNNITYFTSGKPADIYADKYKNKPAVIVSAGPSLEKNIDCLKNLDNNMMIISGGRTLRSLIDKEILPDLLVVVDALPICYDLCKGYIEDLNKPLLFYESTNSDVLANHKGEKLFFTYNNFINEISEYEISKVEIGGSVAHAMTSYAVMLGCNPIIFIGQDLAYTDEKSHAIIAQNRDGKIGFKELKDDKYDIYVDDINGNKVRTSLMLDKYRRFLEEIISSHPEVNFINATEGGARIKGTIEMPFMKAINKYKTNKFKMFNEADYKIDLRKNVIEKIKETKKECEEIINLYNQALALLEDLKKYCNFGNTNKINYILARLDNIDAIVNKKYKNIYLVESLIYPIIYEVMAGKSIDNNLSFKKKIDYIYDENKRFYNSIKEQLNYALEKIDSTLKNL